MASIQCGNCGNTHSSTLEVRACYGQPTKTVSVARAEAQEASKPNFAPASEKQVSFIKGLREQRGLEPLAFTGSKAQASKEIERLLALPKTQPAKSAGVAFTQEEEPVDGIYIIRGEGVFYSEAKIYKVYKMVHGSGRQGVKVLEHTQEVLLGEDGVHNSGVFRYLGLAAKHLPSEAEKMGLEEAKTFGRLYGFCVRCGRTLTDEGSIADGIGPICAGKDW